MNSLNRKTSAVTVPDGTLLLDYDTRQRCRQRLFSEQGEEVGLQLDRGARLVDGDHLLGSDGRVYRVAAAPELLSEVQCGDTEKLTRAAYHLGNRHARVQLHPRRITYRADHVFDAMLRDLGLAVSRVVEAFEPEPGAYHRHARAPGAAGRRGPTEALRPAKTAARRASSP